MRTRLPARATVPSMMASTSSFRAISGSRSFVPLKLIADVREMMRSDPMRASASVNSSVMPSAKYSCEGSPVRFSSGSTASAAMRPPAGGRLDHQITALSASTSVRLARVTVSARRCRRRPTRGAGCVFRA